VHAWASAARGTGYGAHEGGTRARDTGLAVLATTYCVWLLYAAGLKYLLLAALLYAPGALLFAVARREQQRAVFKGAEWALVAVIVILAAAAGYALFTGAIKL
jgi:arginine:ornithine antiporter/lysine permease